MTRHETFPEKLLTTGAAARLLGVHPVTVARWVDEGLIRAITTPGGHRRVPRDEIEKLWSGPKRPKWSGRTEARHESI